MLRRQPVEDDFSMFEVKAWLALTSSREFAMMTTPEQWGVRS
jgi:hypothetical protein